MEFITETIDGQAAADWRGIQQAASRWPRARVRVDEYSEKLMESEKQRKWVNGAAIPFLMDKWGRSREWVKTRLKIYCGSDLFEFNRFRILGEKDPILKISSENELTRRQMKTWIENILDYKPCEDAGLEPPNPEWRRKKVATPLFEGQEK